VLLNPPHRQAAKRYGPLWLNETKNEIEILDDIFNHSDILLKTIGTYEK
jgi:hypothetical protein